MHNPASPARSLHLIIREEIHLLTALDTPLPLELALLLTSLPVDKLLPPHLQAIFANSGVRAIFYLAQMQGVPEDDLHPLVVARRHAIAHDEVREVECVPVVDGDLRGEHRRVGFLGERAVLGVDRLGCPRVGHFGRDVGAEAALEYFPGVDVLCIDNTCQKIVR